jgi:hypothetical protein
MEGLEDITPRVKLWDNNVALIDAYHDMYAPKVHPCHSAKLGHSPQQKLQALV